MLFALKYEHIMLFALKYEHISKRLPLLTKLVLSLPMQRHQVRIVPVAEVEYGFKGGPGKFWVYGYENKVHSPDYPQTCCWGCCCVM